MQTITVVTGFGYFKDASDNIVGKAKLPAGEHPLQDEFTYYEVADQDALDAIEVYQAPQPLIYNPKRFLASCVTDVTMNAIMAKLSDRQYLELSLCLQNANFEMLGYIMNALLTANVIVEDDINYFKSKLESEEGVVL